MKTPVFHSYGKWHLSGVNTWTVNLIRAMRTTEFDSKVLFTGIERSPQPELDNLDIPYVFLDVTAPRSRRQEWRVLKEFLEAHAPCIFITNYDFHRSCAVGTLSPAVRVVAGVHSDEDCYFDELRRIGQNCNAIFCVSSDLHSKVNHRYPKLADRTHFIPHGIRIPQEPPSPRPTDGPLRLCYCNRLQQYQKRVFDLPMIAAELEKLGVDYELDIAGDGPDASELRHRFDNAQLLAPIRFHGRISNTAVMDLCRRTHLFLLTSDFEGLPISLLEAMSVGCVPVVYQIESGIADALSSPDCGFIVPHGDVTEFAQVIQLCGQNLAGLRTLSMACQRDIVSHFSLERMVEDYIQLFQRILTEKSHPTRTSRVVVPYELTVRSRGIRRLRRMIARLVGKNKNLEGFRLRSSE
jgi:glycosyltransferase involved in cell wall biosynthesis